MKVFLRYAIASVIVLATAGLVVCLVTYSPSDVSYEQYQPIREEVNNLGGIPGAYIAHFFYEWLGFGVFPLLGIAAYWAIISAVSGAFQKRRTRIGGSILFAASFCAFAESLPIDPEWMPGSGGILGKFFVALLAPFLGLRPFTILFGFLAFLSVCLATDARLAMVILSGLLRMVKRRKPEQEEHEELEPDPVAAPEPEPETPSPPKEPKPRKKAPPAEPAPPPAPPPAGDYKLPSPTLLTKPDLTGQKDSKSALQEERTVLCRTLSEFGISAEVVNIEVGPVVIQYQLELAAGTKVHKVMALSDDLAMALKTPSVRIVAPIPGKSAVGIEVPNKKRTIVRLRELLEAPEFDRQKYHIPMFLGRDCAGNPIFQDLASMPHLLIAGATGAGKTICLNTIIMSMLMTQYPDHLKLLLVDPKMVEMASFREVPHLISPVVTDMKKAPAILEWAAAKMDERYDTLAEAGVRSLVEYNALGAVEIEKRSERELPHHIPYVVIVIDELADLMSVSAKEVESSITRLAQKSRAVGIHIILATQRPSVDVITGLIKSNLPARISFRVTSKIDSRTILDRNGAEKLLGQGDMLMLPPGTTDLVRSQGAFVSQSEIHAVVEFVKSQAKPEYYEELQEWEEERNGSSEGRDDPLYKDAIRIIVETQRGSASLLQRRLGVGYTRASRFIDMMEEDGVVGSHKEAQARKVLLTLEDLEQEDQSPEDQPVS